MTDEATEPTNETPDADETVPAASELTLPADPTLAALATAYQDAAFETFSPRIGPVQHVARVDRSEYHEFVAAVHEAGFDVFADLCGVDFLRRRPRFEVVLNVLSHALRKRLRVHVGVPGDDPALDSVSDIYPGANFYERETFDLFGIVFVGHPDLTRILLPDDWDGYPLRKDYAVGSVPVQFKEAHKAT